MPDRSVVVRLKAEVAGFQASMRSAQMQVKDFNNDLLARSAKNREGLTTLGLGFTAVGAAAALGVGKAVSAFADFDSSMSAVSAATHETAANMDLLRQAAIDAGAETVFSATEAAGAIENLAKAGISTKDVLGGGLKGSLDLAAAGQMEVADAAEVAATALTQFKLEGKDVPHVADLLAAGAGKAQGDVSDLAMALKQSGLVASQMGLSIEETTGTLAAFASAGLLGSDAGTSFRTMLLRLANPSKEAAQLMADLGINAYDAQGQFVGMSAIAGQLQVAFQGQSQATRDAAMATIFGSDAIRAASVLYSNGAAGVDKWTRAVNDQGYAAETAAIQLDNLKGDLEQLSGSLETLMIGLGEGANGPGRAAVQRLTEIVNWFNGMGPAGKNAVLGIAGVTAAVGLLAGGTLILLPRIAAAKAALETLGTTGRSVAGRIGRVTAAVAALGVSLEVASVSGDKFREWVGATTKDGTQAAKTLEKISAAGEITKGDLDALGAKATDFGDAIHAVFNRSTAENIGGFFSEFGSLGGLLPWGDDAVDEANRFFKSVDAGLTNLVASGKVDEAARVFGLVSAEVERQGGSIDQLNALLPGYQAAISATGDTAADAATSQGGMADQLDASTAAAQAQETAIDDLRQAIEDLTSPTLDLRSAQRDVEQAIDDAAAAAKENGKTLKITTDEGRKNQQALDDIASSYNGLSGAMADNGASHEDLERNVAKGREAFEKMARRMGMSKDAAHALALEVIAIPGSKDVNIKVRGAESGKQAVFELRQALRNTAGTYYADFVTRGGGRSTQGGITKFADGGLITAGSGPRADDVLTRVSRNEFVVNAASTMANLPLIQAINAARGPLVAVPAGERGGSPVSTGDLKAAIREGLAGMSWRVDLDRQGVARISAQGNLELGRRR